MTLSETQTDLTEIQKVFNAQKLNSRSLWKEPVDNRKARLRMIRNWIQKNRGAIHKAMFDDFRKPATEVDAIELFHVLSEIKNAVENLDEWTSPKKTDAPLTMFGTRSSIHYEPRGVCLIISPWNYPFSLAVGPMISALAAGNTVILKPSELTTNVSELLKKMAEELFPREVVTVFEGGSEIAGELLRLPFDHIFFTGSQAVGKIVMKAAAENLTSVTLELGGKSPTIVTPSANLDDAAERIAVSKFVNNGQTCVAPDYVIVHEKIEKQFIAKLKEQVIKRFAENGSFESSGSYCRIVNRNHFIRLNEILQEALHQGAKPELTGNVDEHSGFFHPVILSQVPPGSRIMTDEIFGPILPILTYKDLGETIQLINSKPKALALYIFSSKSSEIKRIILETSAGGVCVNESGIHFLHSKLPFGGVNHSGMGKSHGYYGFLTFSHEKPVLKQKSGFTPVKVFYPPYTKASKKIMDWFLKLF